MPLNARSAWLHTLVRIVAVLALAAGAGALLHRVWPMLAIAALGLVAWDLWRLRQLLARLTERRRLEPSTGDGVWNELDRQLHRGQAEMRGRKRRLLDMAPT